MAVEYALVEVSGLLGGEPVQSQVSRMSRSGDRKERSVELSTLA